MAINENVLYQLARLALEGDSRDVQLYIRRLAKKVEGDDPALARKLNQLVVDGMNTFRQASPVPVDSDSHLRLARIEPNITQEPSPILEPQIQKSAEQLIRERQMLGHLISKGVSPTKSALFVGPPGVGKTMTAKWIASRLQKTLVTLDLSAVISSFLGKTGVNLRNVLDFAKEQDCILLLDEFDAIAKRRDDDTEIGELKRLVTVLLQEVDQWPESGLLIAATNHGSLLDPAVWRRFDIVLEFPMPSADSVEKILKMYWGGNSPNDENVLSLLSILWKERSPSDIARGVSQIRRQSIVFSKDIMDAVLDVVGTELRQLDKVARKSLVPILSQHVFSEREIAKIVGLARATVSKTIKAT